jgi:hypothetical protein
MRCHTLKGRMLEDEDDRSLALACKAGTGTGRGGLGGEGNLHDDDSVRNASKHLRSLEDRKFRWWRAKFLNYNCSCTLDVLTTVHMSADTEY